MTTRCGKVKSLHNTQSLTSTLLLHKILWKESFKMERPKLNLRIAIEINQQPSFGGGGLRLEETLILPERSFMEMCAILAQFKELADRFRKEQ